MCWIKVTPETMPPGNQCVMATVKDSSGHKWIDADIRWNEKEKKWEAWHSDGFWENILGGEVTHWMPLPPPAED